MANPQRSKSRRIPTTRTHEPTQRRATAAPRRFSQVTTVGESRNTHKRRQKPRAATPRMIVHKQPHTAKARSFRIPEPQAARIVQRYIAGENIRAIAREEGRDRGTVTRIVKSEDMRA